MSYKINLHLYFNKNRNRDQPIYPVFVCFGDGLSKWIDVGFTPSYLKDIGNFTQEHTYYFEHTYTSPGLYQIWFQVIPDPEVNNTMPNAEEYYFIETRFSVDPASHCNNSLQVLNPPNIINPENMPYLYNPTIFDIDGDSISFNFINPTKNGIDPFPGYSFPVTKDISTNNTLDKLELSRENGSMYWNSPSPDQKILYAIAMNEWRLFDQTWFIINTTTMYITEEYNEPSKLNDDIIELSFSKDDFGIIAGQLVDINVLFDINQSDSITIFHYGEPFITDLTNASFSLEQADQISGPAIENIKWETNAMHVRDQPWQFTIRAETTHSINRSLYIWISNGPSNPEVPSNLSAEINEKGHIVINWSDDANDELGYIIERKRNEDGEFRRLSVLSRNTDFFEDPNILPFVKYDYRIIAIGTGNKKISETITAYSDIITELPVDNNDNDPLIYPNPSKGSFKVRNISKYNWLEIIDLSGRKVWHEELHTTERYDQEMDFNPGLSKGTYILNVCSPNNTTSKKIVIN